MEIRRAKGAILWRQQEKAKRGPDKKNGQRSKRDTSDAKTLEELGVSKPQMQRWQQLADDPKAVRDYLRDCEDVPTTAGAIAARRPLAGGALSWARSYGRGCWRARVEGMLAESSELLLN